MRLHPVNPDRVPALSDADAARPEEAPGHDALVRKRDALTARLAQLQRVLYADRRHALLVVLQGRDAGGKDGTIRHVFGPCNPQGCEVTSFGVPTETELAHDFLWRVHAAVPPRGMIGLFNRSHYEDVLAVRVQEIAPKRVWSKRFDQINAFEQLLATSGVTIVKLFLHVGHDEQRRRLLERLEDPAKNWKFRAGDLDDRANWDAYTAAYRDVLRRCSTRWAPWYVVPADDKRVRDYLIARLMVRTLERLDLRYPAAADEVAAYAKLLQ